VGIGIAIVDEPVTHIVAGGIIAILRLERAEDLSPAAEAIREDGVTAIEATFTMPGSIGALGPARAKLGRDVLLGIGEVLTPEASRDAIRAGAQFIAAPTLNPEVVRVCREARVPVIAGAFTATEIVHAWELAPIRNS
jgi:2-dehydro-3-deoxyphosphogluconate aldolase/(4S)-4-hydroxy-2-oxoglutarate aldolase